MKKILAVLLILAMAFALFACSGGDSGGSPASSSDNSGGGSSSNESSAAPSAAPSSSAPANPDSSVAAENNPVPSELPPEANPFDEIEGSVGYVGDNVDHWARPSYHIVYYNYQVTNLTAQITDSLNKLGEVYNFTIEQLTANGDADVFFNNLYTILIKNPDGLITDISQEQASRTAEIIRENDVPCVNLFSRTVDTNDCNLIPTVIMDQFYNGERQLEYLNSVYTDYWGDIDRADITLFVLDFSTNLDINMRGQGAESKWKELFGDQKTIYGDTAAITLSAEAGFEVGNSILATNPDVKYWFIVCTVEDVALGCSRAVEALDMQDRVLITASGASILPGEWDNGYDGCWIANYSVPPFLYAGSGVFGLLALIDGRATVETLWPEYFLPGDQAARFMLGSDMMTRDTYVEFIASFMRNFGVEP